MFRPTKQYVLISEYALISDMYLIMQKYGTYEMHMRKANKVGVVENFMRTHARTLSSHP